MSFFNPADILQGLQSAFGPQQLLWLCIGVLTGLFGGTLPGISGATMLAVLVGFVFKFPLDCMVIALAGICAASCYSGSTAGILYNVPGDAPAIPSTMEGYPMTKGGRSLDALTAAISGSFVGGVIGSVLLILVVPLFLYLVKFVGSGERALFALWAMVIVSGGALTKDDTMRGILSMGVGLFLGTLGMQENLGAIRYVYDYAPLWDGVDLLWVILGIFAIPQLLQLPYIRVKKGEEVKISYRSFFGRMKAHLKNNKKLMGKTALLGTLIGAIPGIGSVTASWVGYSSAQSATKNPELFGKGAVDGIIGAETANNASIPGAFIPLLSLGIPGSATNAIILGAFIAQGIFPGPQLMTTNAPIVWTILFGIFLSSIVFVLMGVPFIRLAQKLVNMPSRYLIMSIGVLTMLGTYLSKYSVFGAMATLVIGLLVIVLGSVGLIPSAMLMGYILGPTIEVEFVRAYQIGGFARFLQPASLCLLAITALTFVWGIVKSMRERKKQRDKALNQAQKEVSIKDRMEEMEEAESGGVTSSHADLIFGVAGLALGGYILYSMSSILMLARIWPLIIAGLFVALPSLMLIGRSVVNRGEMRGMLGRMPAAVKGFFTSKRTLDGFVLLGSMALSIALIDLLGFVLCAALFSFIILYYFHPKLLPALLGTIGAGGIVWIMKVAFAFSIPGGIFRI